MQLGRCDSEAARWFLSRGYVVAYALRRGYGETGGSWAEDIGSCSDPDYVRAGIETARDIDAVVQYATALPFAKGRDAQLPTRPAGGGGAGVWCARARRCFGSTRTATVTSIPAWPARLRAMTNLVYKKKS
jgi:hypothetical protein